MNFNKINSFIEKSISSAKSAFEKVPSILLYCAAIQRSGVSALLTTSNIISRLPEAGISNGVNADGTPNVTSQLVRIIVEEVYKELRDNCGVQVSVPPGSIKFLGNVTTTSGTYIVNGTNVNAALGSGILGVNVDK